MSKQQLNCSLFTVRSTVIGPPENEVKHVHLEIPHGPVLPLPPGTSSKLLTWTSPYRDQITTPLQAEKQAVSL